MREVPTVEGGPILQKVNVTKSSVVVAERAVALYGGGYSSFNWCTRVINFDLNMKCRRSMLFCSQYAESSQGQEEQSNFS